jgi:hypothetical protein
MSNSWAISKREQVTFDKTTIHELYQNENKLHSTRRQFMSYINTRTSYIRRDDNSWAISTREQVRFDETTIHELYQNENKLHSTRRQFPLCTRLTRLIGFLSASSLNEQSVSRHAALLWPGFLSASSLNELSTLDTLSRFRATCYFCSYSLMLCAS